MSMKDEAMQVLDPDEHLAGNDERRLPGGLVGNSLSLMISRKDKAMQVSDHDKHLMAMIGNGGGNLTIASHVLPQSSADNGDLRNT